MAFLRRGAAIAGVALLSGVGALLYGAQQWQRNTSRFARRLAAARVPSPALRYDARAIEGLPPPVVRFFRTVLRDGQPLVTSARIRHAGEFNASEGEEQWKPFTSTQVFTVFPPGFIWDARVEMVPLVPALVIDSYVSGAGGLRATLGGLFTIVRNEGTPEVAAGSLQRYLAEAMWFPTALLPASGVRWTPIDDSRARAELTDGATTVSLEFRFNDRNEIAVVYTPGRFRQVGDIAVPTPWSATGDDYVERGGMRVPLVGEVRWHLPDRQLPYWRGRIVEVEYEFRLNLEAVRE